MSLKTLYTHYRPWCIGGLSLALHLTLMALAPSWYPSTMTYARNALVADLAAAPATNAYPLPLRQPENSFFPPLHIERARLAALHRHLHKTQGEDRLPEVIFRIEPEYPYIALRAKIEGKIWIRVLVDQEGRVERLGKITGHPAFHESASKAVQQWHFSPALQGGQPARIWVRIPFRFELD
jgi:TonB family protein